MKNTEFKDPFNFVYLGLFLLSLVIPTLPASLTWLKLSGLI